MRPLVAISACLLGHEVRYDGGHRREPMATDRLAAFVEWVPLCPETEAGLGVPREPIRLERHADGIRVREVVSGEDRSEALDAAVRRRLAELEPRGLCGLVLKADSPSCGLANVPVVTPEGEAAGVDAGVFARAARAAWPDLPAIPEQALGDLGRREAFLSAVFTAARWQAAGAAAGGEALTRFHALHRRLVAAHDRRGALALDPLAERGEVPAYRRRLAAAFREPAWRDALRREVRALARDLADHLPWPELLALDEVLRDWEEARTPLGAARAALRAAARRHDPDGLGREAFLEPFPGPLEEGAAPRPEPPLPRAPERP